jgi:hypothetical protein
METSHSYLLSIFAPNGCITLKYRIRGGPVPIPTEEMNIPVRS